MSVSINNLFNYSRSLPVPFDTMTNKKVKVASMYGAKTESTLCGSVIKAVHAMCRCMNGTGEGAVGQIDTNKSVAEYKSSVGPDAYHLVVFDAASGSALASVYDKNTELIEQYVAHPSQRDGAAIFFALMPFLMSDAEFDETFQEYYDQFIAGYYTGIAREEVRDALIARLDVQGSIPKPEHIPVPVVAEVPPTDIASRSDTYTGLLSKLTLASDHRQNLRNRGLSDEEIDRLGYRTTPVVGMQTIARQLQSSGYYLSGVPGFYRKDGKWSFACESRGILIPVRDSKGRIQGMQIRRDNATRRKFRWVSSTGRTDGCKAEGWVHIAGEPRAIVLLTEGPMKADVIHYLTGQTVLAVAGVNALTQLELILPQLHEQGVERIMTAFDMDFMENPHVQGGYRTLVSLLSDAGFRYGTYLWDPRYKGLDDYVWEHCFQRQLS